MIKVGDKVTFLNDVGEGTVVEITGNNMAIVEDADGFDEKYPLSELVLKKSTEAYKLDGLEHVISVQEKINAESREKQLKEFASKTSKLESYKADILEVDLHIEELIDSHHGMSNSHILSVQMANFKRELNVAIGRRAKKLIVIHGVGVGILKQEIRNELYNNYPEFEVHDASYRLYGYGATEIILR